MQDKCNESSPYCQWADFIRASAIFCVVWLHTSSPLLYKFEQANMLFWWLGNLSDSAVRMCVPLFFMLSGYLLLPRRESLRYYFKRRFSRLAVPWLSWSVFYVFWDIFYNHKNITFIAAVKNIIADKVYFHMWFLYALAGLYLIIPILRVYVEHAADKYIFYYVALWFLCAGFMPQLVGVSSAVTGTSLRFGMDVRMVTGYSGYLLLGLVLGRMKYSRKWVYINLILYLLCVSVTAVGTFYVTRLSNAYRGDFYLYLSANVIIMSVSSFVLLKHFGERFNGESRLFRVIQMISSASLGIYLIHPMILSLLSDGKLGIALGALAGNPMCTIPGTALTAFLLSFVAVIILKKVPLIRIVVGEVNTGLLQ